MFHATFRLLNRLLEVKSYFFLSFSSANVKIIFVLTILLFAIFCLSFSFIHIIACVFRVNFLNVNRKITKLSWRALHWRNLSTLWYTLKRNLVFLNNMSTQMYIKHDLALFLYFICSGNYEFYKIKTKTYIPNISLNCNIRR